MTRRRSTLAAPMAFERTAVEVIAVEVRNRLSGRGGRRVAQEAEAAIGREARPASGVIACRGTNDGLEQGAEGAEEMPQCGRRRHELQVADVCARCQLLQKTPSYPAGS